jgi:tripartite ATP-independent transporter DctM subunit
MTPMMTFCMFVLFLIFLALKMPMSLSMGLSALLIFLVQGENLLTLPQSLALGVSSYPLMAVPFFILAGNVMNGTGLTTRIFNFCKAVVGHLPGGLAQVIVVAEMILSGITGTAVGDCAGLGTVAVPMMEKAGFRKPFAAAVCISAGTLGPIIPPSLMLVIYAVEAGTSVAKLFIGGIVPGGLMGLCLMVYIYFVVKTGKENCPRSKRATFREVLKALKGGFFGVVAPGVIVIAFITGLVTPTEAGVIATLYSIVVGILYGDFKFRAVPKILEESLILTALIMFIIATATAMGHIMTMEQIPLKLSKYVLSLTTNKYLLLFAVNVFLLFLGSILEGMPILIIMTPILVPMMQSVGVDLVHFGVVMSLAIVIGIMTPPMAIGIFILVGITGCSFEEISRSTVKFLIPLIIALFIITYVPAITLFLPNLLLK